MGQVSAKDMQRLSPINLLGGRQSTEAFVVME